MELPCGFFRLFAEGLIKSDIQPMARPSIKQGPGRDLGPKHLFQAKRLCAQLDLVAFVRFWFSALVLYRKRPPCASIRAMKFHDVSFPYQAQSQRPKRHPSGYPDIAPRLPAYLMHPFVHDPAFGGEAVLIPRLFDMDKSALPLAEDKVLQGGEGQKVGFGKHY
jgi:hypothetical protein